MYKYYYQFKVFLEVLFRKQWDSYFAQYQFPDVFWCTVACNHDPFKTLQACSSSTIELFIPFYSYLATVGQSQATFLQVGPWSSVIVAGERQMANSNFRTSAETWEWSQPVWNYGTVSTHARRGLGNDSEGEKLKSLDCSPFQRVL